MRGTHGAAAREENGVLRVRNSLTLLTILAFGLAIRVLLPWPAVVTNDGIIPPGGADEFYHLRRIEFSVEQFPAVLEDDPYIGHPDVGEVVWPPLWDLGIAAVARPFGAAGDRGRLEAVVAAVPPLIGIASIFLAFAIARRHFGRRAGWTAAALLAVMPAHYLSSRLAKSDHHVGAMLATTWLLSAGMRWLSVTSTRSAVLPWRMAIELGLALACVLMVWTGALLHVGILLATSVVVLLADRDPQVACARAWSLAIACAVAALAIAPFSLGVTWREYGGFSPLVLSTFHPVFFASGALILAVCGSVWARFDWGRGQRSGFGLALGALGLSAVWLGVPELGNALATGAGWFQESEDFQAQVLELKPMWTAAGVFRVSVPQLLFTHVVMLALPLAGWLAWRAARGAEDSGAWLLVAWSVAFFAASSSQIRFSNELAVPLALLAGFWVQRARSSQRFATVAALSLCAVITAWTVYAGPVRDWVRTSQGEQPLRLGSDERVAALIPFARWLGDHSPVTPGWLDPEATPGYAVLTPWGQGHLVRYYARRPMVQDNFGVYGGRESYEAAERYYGAEREAIALNAARERGVRYVLASPEGSGHGTRYSRRSMTSRLARDRGGVGRGEAGERLEALRHHRLLHEVAWRPGIDEQYPGALDPGVAAYRWFEIVEGARVVGRAAPGSSVQARLVLTNETGQTLRYESAARASADGRYELTLPYPTDEPSGTWRTNGPYTVRTARARASVEVAESAVMHGDTVPGPDLADSPAGNTTPDVSPSRKRTDR